MAPVHQSGRTGESQMKRTLLRICLCILFAASAASAAERAIDKEVVVNATVDQVWSAWTTRAGIISFFAPDAEIDPHPDGAFHIYFNPDVSPGMRGADDMRFLALQPKKMISFDWNAPPKFPEVRKQRTFVVLRMEPVSESKTHLSLHQTGWGEGGEWDQVYAYFDQAWSIVLNRLQARYETGPRDWAH
jgi:uncharacterized protein YndB with AHSA1/START domain